MTKVAEVYQKLIKRMLEGLMIHEELANYYDFLGLGGYKRCHEYHFFKEMMNYRSACRYFINHHNMLIPESLIDAPEVIPESWYNHKRADVDTSTRKNAVKEGLTKWVTWERETKKMYEELYMELLNEDEVSSAEYIKQYVCDVDKELKKAERYWLHKEAINYDMSVIIEEQRKKHDKYKKKCKEELHIELC